MIIQLAILAILYFLMTGLSSITSANEEVGAATTTAVLGFILLASFFFGKISTRFHLPQITGYLIAGILFGPFGLRLFEMGHVESLKLIDEVALAFIALAVGGELDLKFIKKQGAKIAAITAIQFAAVFIGVVVLFYPVLRFSVSGILPQSSDALYAALVLGVIAVANSPATAMAVINETRSKGNLTESTLGITVIKDILVITLFAFIISWIHSSMGAHAAEEPAAIFYAIFSETVISIIAGAAIGIFV
ncbi:MAG: cation:proton antiporter, partial [Nitrospinota bacterium]